MVPKRGTVSWIEPVSWPSVTAYERGVSDEVQGWDLRRVRKERKGESMCYSPDRALLDACTSWRLCPSPRR